MMCEAAAFIFYQPLILCACDLTFINGIHVCVGNYMVHVFTYMVQCQPLTHTLGR